LHSKICSYQREHIKEDDVGGAAEDERDENFVFIFGLLNNARSSSDFTITSIK
jgi:hypothetical protein